MARTSIQNLSARIDWEPLPSLRGLLRRGFQRARPVWSDTVQSKLDDPCESTPFEEVMPGLAMREVHEPDIFMIFFAEHDARLQAGVSASAQD
jgi:hypothetical protein